MKRDDGTGTNCGLESLEFLSGTHFLGLKMLVVVMNHKHLPSLHGGRWETYKKDNKLPRHRSTFFNSSSLLDQIWQNAFYRSFWLFCRRFWSVVLSSASCSVCGMHYFFSLTSWLIFSKLLNLFTHYLKTTDRQPLLVPSEDLRKVIGPGVSFKYKL